MAFKNAGLLFGAIGTIVVGLLCTHCVHILVRFEIPHNTMILHTMTRSSPADHNRFILHANYNSKCLVNYLGKAQNHVTTISRLNYHLAVWSRTTSK